MVKNFVDQNISARNFKDRHGRTLTATTAKSRNKGKSVSFGRKQGDGHQWKANGNGSKGDACSLIRVNVENRSAHRRRLHNRRRKNEGKNSSKGRSLRGKSPSGKRSRRLCQEFLSGNCTNPSCDSWDAPVRFENSIELHIGPNVLLCAQGLMVTQTNDGGKEAVALLENAQQCCSIEECTAAGVCFRGNGAADLQVDFTEGQEIHACAA